MAIAGRDIVQTYLRAGGAVVRSVEDPRVRDRWSMPSALERMSLGELAAHLTRSITQVQLFLDEPDPESDRPISAEAYFADLDGTHDLDSGLNAGVRQRSQEGAATGPDGVARTARATLSGLTSRLPDEPAGRQVLVFGSRPMLLEQYLRTRLVEFAVHLDDLRISLAECGDPDSPDDRSHGPDAFDELPSDARAAAIDVMVGAARHRHGDLAVLRALARRERDPVHALRVF